MQAPAGFIAKARPGRPRNRREARLGVLWPILALGFSVAACVMVEPARHSTETPPSPSGNVFWSEL